MSNSLNPTAGVKSTVVTVSSLDIAPSPGTPGRPNGVTGFAAIAQNSYGKIGWGDVTISSKLGDLSDVDTVGESAGDLLIFDGTIWKTTDVSVSGISELNGVNGEDQFLTTASTGIDFTISAAGNTTNVFSIPSASRTTRGLLESSDATSFSLKLTSELQTGNVFVGNGLGNAEEVVLSGDLTVASNGVMTLSDYNPFPGQYGSDARVPVLSIAFNSGRIFPGSVPFGPITIDLVGTGSDISFTGSPAVPGSSMDLEVPTANGSTRGVVSSADWARFDLTHASVLPVSQISVGSVANTATAVPVSGDFTLTDTGTLDLIDLVASGQAGDATNASVITVDARGRITSYSSTPILSTSLVIDATGADLSVSGAPVSPGGTATLSIPSASVSSRGVVAAADWTNFDSKLSSITLASGNMMVGDATNVPASVSISGSGTLVSNGTFSLAPRPAAAGTHISADISVNAQGILVSATDGAANMLPSGPANSIQVKTGSNLQGYASLLAGTEAMYAGTISNDEAGDLILESDSSVQLTAGNGATKGGDVRIGGPNAFAWGYLDRFNWPKTGQPSDTTYMLRSEGALELDSSLTLFWGRAPAIGPLYSVQIADAVPNTLKVNNNLSIDPFTSSLVLQERIAAADGDPLRISSRGTSGGGGRHLSILTGKGNNNQGEPDSGEISVLAGVGSGAFKGGDVTMIGGDSITGFAGSCVFRGGSPINLHDTGTCVVSGASSATATAYSTHGGSIVIKGRDDDIPGSADGTNILVSTGSAPSGGTAGDLELEATDDGVGGTSSGYIRILRGILNYVITDLPAERFQGLGIKNLSLDMHPVNTRITDSVGFMYNNALTYAASVTEPVTNAIGYQRNIGMNAVLGQMILNADTRYRITMRLQMRNTTSSLPVTFSLFTLEGARPIVANIRFKGNTDQYSCFVSDTYITYTAGATLAGRTLFVRMDEASVSSGYFIPEGGCTLIAEGLDTGI